MANDGQGLEQQVEIGIKRLYTKDLSFESPQAPQVFSSTSSPNIQLDLSAKSKKLQEFMYEVELRVTVTAENSEGTVFIAEVEQGGIFSVKGITGQGLAQILGAYCPGLLFPYVREIIDSLVTRGSFPPLMIAPVNFDILYQQKLQQGTN